MSIYLVEATSLDPAGKEVVLRWGDAGLTTRPNEVPPNTNYAPRVGDPGNLERHLFSNNRTMGDVSVGAGEVRLRNIEGKLDYLRHHAFDGRTIRIFSLADKRQPFITRRLVFEGTMAQTEFQDGDFVITVRDWLEALRQNLQTLLYKGTTTQGGMQEAEGGVDLKDKRRAMLFGSRRGIAPVLVDGYDHIYEVSAGRIHGVPVARDRGVPYTPKGDFPTLAALKAATLEPAEFATCLTLGLVRSGGTPDGLFTVDAFEGATVADRTAAQISGRILVKAGMKVGEDFYDADLAALDQSAPYECGVWFGAEADATTLSALTFVLGGVGASSTPDYAGFYRIRQFKAPVAGSRVLSEKYFLTDDSDFDRDAPGDFGDGLPVKQVTLKYELNDTVVNENDLDVNTTAEWKSFAGAQWRQVVKKSQPIADRHPHAHEIIIETALCHAADAEIEASRRLALYAIVREVFRVKVPSYYAKDIDLSMSLTLVASRYGLNAGRPVVVIGVTDQLEPEHTTLLLWG